MRISDWSSDVCSSDLAAIRRTRYDAAILDVGMLDGCGTDLVAPLRKRTPSLPVVLFTAQEVDGAPKDGIDLILVKSRASLDTLVRERSEEHTSELQSLMRIAHAVFRLKKKNAT